MNISYTNVINKSKSPLAIKLTIHIKRMSVMFDRLNTSR